MYSALDAECEWNATSADMCDDDDDDVDGVDVFLLMVVLMGDGDDLRCWLLVCMAKQMIVKRVPNSLQ